MRKNLGKCIAIRYVKQRYVQFSGTKITLLPISIIIASHNSRIADGAISPQDTVSHKILVATSNY